MVHSFSDKGVQASLPRRDYICEPLRRAYGKLNLDCFSWHFSVRSWGGGGSKRQTFVWIQMSSLPVAHLFLFPLWQGMLTFQENSTSREQPTQTIFLRCDFPGDCDFIIWSKCWVGGKKNSMHFLYEDISLNHALDICGRGSPVLWLSGDSNVKQNGKVHSHSLWVTSPRHLGKVRETSACSRRILDRGCRWTY